MGLIEIAEICGIHAGDGYLRNDGKRIELDISTSLEEQTYYDLYVIPLFSRSFQINIKGNFFPSRNTYGFVIRDKKIIEKMHSLGFPYGKKSHRVRVPTFILESKNNVLKTSFLRGFLDTDGCIAFDKRYSCTYSLFKRKYHTYPRLTLNTVSKKLSLDIQRLLNDLEIKHWVQIYKPAKLRESTKNIIWIRGKNFEKWMKIIGSRNPIKYSKVEIWKKYGYCPVRTTYAERIKITKHELNPERFYWARSSMDRASDLSLSKINKADRDEASDR